MCILGFFESYNGRMHNVGRQLVTGRLDLVGGMTRSIP
jgi:hypothetical protein